MSIKIALLKSGESVISDMKELVQDGEVRGYSFEEPYIVDFVESSDLLLEESGSDKAVEVSFSPWIAFTKDKKILVRADWIVTVITPLEEVEKLYKEMNNG